MCICRPHFSQVRTGEYLANGICERIDIIWWYDPCVPAIAQHLWDLANMGGYYRALHCHRLQYHDR